MKKEQRFLQRLTEEMDLDGEPVPGMAVVELCGDNRVLIENHLGMCHYSQEKICVKVPYGQIAVCGCGLELSQMTKDRLIIAGKINTLSVHRR